MQCFQFSAGETSHAFMWSGLASRQYSLAETVTPSPPYSPVSIPPFILNVLSLPDIDLGTLHNDLTLGWLEIVKRDGAGYQVQMPGRHPARPALRSRAQQGRSPQGVRPDLFRRAPILKPIQTNGRPRSRLTATFAPASPT